MLTMKRLPLPILRLAAMACCLALGTQSAQATFTISLNFDTSVTAPQQAVFNTAKATWESYVTGYQTGISLTGITINASIPAIDGAGGILGQAGPTAGVVQGGFTLTTTGLMKFDSDDVVSMSNETFNSVILHEMAHVMGLGTWWTDNGVYVDGTGQYTGANALAAYQSEFDSGATFVPIELGGGSGTADGHWNEVDGGAGPTTIVGINPSITNSFGKDFRDELMTGWLNSNSFISNTTVMSFRDLGFTTVSLAVVPEPASMAFFGVGLLGLALARRRSQR